MRDSIPRPTIRSMIACALMSVLVLTALSVDPEPRGPLAIAADLWLLGHDAEARRSFARGEVALIDAGVDPSRFTLSLDLTPRGHGDSDRAFALLDRLARDDRSKAVYRALWFARAGDREAARNALPALPSGQAPRRLLDLVAALRD